MQRTLLIIILVLFGALSAAAVWQHGYVGVFASSFQNLAGIQIVTDLAISLTLVLVWMWHDAKANGRNILPWIVLTLAAGSFGPLIYLLTRKANSK